MRRLNRWNVERVQMSDNDAVSEAAFGLGQVIGQHADDAARFRKLMDLAVYGGTYGKEQEHVWQFRPIMGPHKNLLDAIDAM